jgi:hypothetical protein
LLKVGAFRRPFERIRQNIRAPERPDAFWRQSLIGIGSRMQCPIAILVIGGISISLLLLLNRRAASPARFGAWPESR